MIPTHASFMNNSWGWGYRALLCPVECVHGDGIAHFHGQANQTQLKQIEINLLISDSFQHIPAPAINQVIASPGTALWALESEGLLCSTELGFQRKLFCIIAKKFSPHYRFL